MDPVFLVSRVLHVALGVFWAGAIFFVTWMLLPAVRGAGPEGLKVMAALVRRGLLNLMPVVAVLTVVTGIHLLWSVSGGFGADYFLSARGHTYGLGAIASVVALGLGVGILRPSNLRAAALAGAAAKAEGAERERLIAEANAQRARGARASTIIAWLLVVAALTMALGRYV